MVLDVVTDLFPCFFFQDFPDDPTGNLDEFKDFVKENYEICKMIGLVVVAVQVCPIFFNLFLFLFPSFGSEWDSVIIHMLGQTDLLMSFNILVVKHDSVQFCFHVKNVIIFVFALGLCQGL